MENEKALVRTGRTRTNQRYSPPGVVTKPLAQGVQTAQEKSGEKLCFFCACHQGRSRHNKVPDNVSRPSSPIMTLCSSAKVLVTRLLFMTLSSNFARGIHGACAEFGILRDILKCQVGDEAFKTCAHVINGIMSPELCSLPMCQLKSKVGMLITAAVGDFVLQIILAIVLVVIYLPKYHPAERRTLCHRTLRCIKLVIPFLSMVTCIFTLLCFKFLSQAALPLIDIECVRKKSSSYWSVEYLSSCVIVLLLTYLKFVSLAILGAKDVCERQTSAVAQAMYQDFAEITAATEAQTTRAIRSRSCCECIFTEVIHDMSLRKRYQLLRETTEANELNSSVDGETVFTDEVNTSNDDTTGATDTCDEPTDTNEGVDTNEADQNPENEGPGNTYETTQTTVPPFSQHGGALLSFVVRSHSWYDRDMDGFWKCIRSGEW